MSTTEQTTVWDATVRSDPEYMWLMGLGPCPGPRPETSTPQPPAQATPPAAQADEPGPAVTDGTTSAGPVAGPGDARTSAPGAPLDGTEPATPPAGGEPSAEAPGAGQSGSEGEAAPGDVVTREEVEAEFGPARTESEPGQ